MIAPNYIGVLLFLAVVIVAIGFIQWKIHNEQVEYDEWDETLWEVAPGVVYTTTMYDGTFTSRKDYTEELGWVSGTGSRLYHPIYGWVENEKLEETSKNTNNKCSWCGSYKTEVRCTRCGGE